MSGFKKMILEFLMNFIQNFDTNMTQAADVLTSSEVFSGTAYTVMEGIQAALKPVCLIIITICFLLELLKISMKMDSLKWEWIVKICAKFVLAKVIIDVAPSLLQTLYLTAGEWTTAAVTASGGIGSTLGTTAYDKLNILFASITWYQALGLAVTMIIPFLAIMLCGLIIKIMAYGRMFELYIYIAVSPLPCSFFPLDEGSGDGINRVTFKFFKAFFAVCLQGLFMIICMKIFDAVVAQTLETAIAAVAEDGGTASISSVAYNIFVGAVCLTMAITKCGSWAKSILDVN